MKRILLVFTIIGVAVAISATLPKYASDRNIKSSRNLKQQGNESPQANFNLELINNADHTFDILLTSTTTSISYGPYTLNGDSIISKSIPADNYDIQVTPETMPSNFFATVLPGCSDLYEGYPGSTATIYCNNIPLNASSDCSSSIVTDIANGSVIKQHAAVC